MKIKIFIKIINLYKFGFDKFYFVNIKLNMNNEKNYKIHKIKNKNIYKINKNFSHLLAFNYYMIKSSHLLTGIFLS